MGTLTLILSVLFSLAGSNLWAQGSAEFEKTREAMQKQKDAVIAADMKLTEQEDKLFWPLYQEYQTAQRKLQDRAFKMMAEYARERENETFSDEKAKAMLDEYLDIEREDLRLKRIYREKFSKILPAKKVMRYFQLENKIAAMVNYQITQMVPLAK
jgi:hypothetical protein